MVDIAEISACDSPFWDGWTEAAPINTEVNMRKTFLLGGSPFTAPDPIGAGIRARAKQISADINDEKGTKLSTEDVIDRYSYEYFLRLLELLLTPDKGSPSVKESYDSATDEEVKDVMDFFSVSVSGKTILEHSKASDSPAIKKTPRQKA
jgi:hypothetical protein